MKNHISRDEVLNSSNKEKSMPAYLQGFEDERLFLESKKTYILQELESIEKRLEKIKGK